MPMPSSVRAPVLLLLCMSSLFAGCGWIGSEPQPGIYRGVIEVPGGELPFGLELVAGSESAPLGAYLLDGTARLAIEHVEQREKTLELVLPGAAGTLTFTTRGKHLTGTLKLAVNSGLANEFAFSAERDLGYRFFPEVLTDNADVAGRWSVAIMRTANTTVELVAEFVQSHDQVAGTFHGDESQQAVTGQVRDEELRLSAFDGRTALLITASVNDAGELEGNHWSSTTGTAAWQARRNPDAVIETEPVTTEFELQRYY